MTLGEKLKALRRQAGISQEKLAEQLGVSRQAVTRWETDGGIPDIENLMAVAAVFHTSIDILLGEAQPPEQIAEYQFESITEYDVDFPKRFDIHMGGANALYISGYDGEKLHIRLASNTLATLQRDFKVKIDDMKSHMDIDLNRSLKIPEADAKAGLDIFLQLPNAYARQMELAANAPDIHICTLACERIELDIKTKRVLLEDVPGDVEIDCNLDMEVICRTLPGTVDINQISATSRIYVPEGVLFRAMAKGIKTRIFYERDGQEAENFSAPDAQSLIALNGMRSELAICACKNGPQ